MPLPVVERWEDAPATTTPPVVSSWDEGPVKLGRSRLSQALQDALGTFEGAGRWITEKAGELYSPFDTAAEQRRQKDLGVLDTVSPPSVVRLPRPQAQPTLRGDVGPTEENLPGERTAGDVLKAVPRQAYLGVAQGGGGLVRAILEAVGADETAGRVAAQNRARAREMEAAAGRFSPDPKPIEGLGLTRIKPSERGVMQALSQAVSQGPGTVAAVAVPGGLPAKLATLLAGVGPQVQGTSFHKYREEGLSPLLAFLGATGQTAAEVVPEALPLAALVKMPLPQLGALVKGNPQAVAQLAQYAGVTIPAEYASEFASTAGNWLVDKGLADPTATLERLGDDLKATFEQMLVQAPATTVIGAGTRYAPKVARAVEAKVSPTRGFARALQEAIDATELAPATEREITARFDPGKGEGPVEPAYQRAKSYEVKPPAPVEIPPEQPKERTQPDVLEKLFQKPRRERTAEDLIELRALAQERPDIAPILEKPGHERTAEELINLRDWRKTYAPAKVVEQPGEGRERPGAGAQLQGDRQDRQLAPEQPVGGAAPSRSDRVQDQARVEVAPAREELIANPVPKEATPEQKVTAMRELTAANRPVVGKLMQAVESAIGVKSKDSEKKPELIIAKAKRPSILESKPWFQVEHVRDAYRFKTILDDHSQVEKALEEAKKAGIEFVKIDTEKVLRPKEWGFRPLSIDLKMPNGQLVEWYFLPHELEAVKDRGHELFDRWRNRDLRQLTPDELREYERDVTDSRKLYDDAWAAYLKRTGQDESAVAASLARLSASGPTTGAKSRESESPERGRSYRERGIQEPATRIAERPSETTSTRPSAALETEATDNIVRQEEEAIGVGEGRTRRPQHNISFKKFADDLERDKDGTFTGSRGMREKELKAVIEKTVEAAHRGRLSRKWYEYSTAQILKMFNGDVDAADRFIQMVAITSANTEVKANFTIAFKALMQYAQGQPINVQSAEVNRKLNDLLYFGVPWEGRKTNTFYSNFAEHLHGVKSKETTQDVHMARLYLGVDAPSDTEYTFGDKVTKYVAKQMGWSIEETQAAIWVAVKADGLFKRMREQQKYGDKTDNAVRSIAMREAAVNYGELVARMGEFKVPDQLKIPGLEEVRAANQVMTAEVRPSTKTKVGKAVTELPFEDQARFQEGALAQTFGDTGQFFESFGLDRTRYRFFGGAGGYEGQRAPNLVATIRAPTELVGQMARAWMYIFKQDAVPFFRADKDLLEDPKATRGVRFSFEKNLTDAAERKFFDTLRELNPELGYTKTGPNEVVVMNFTSMDNIDFLEGLDKLVSTSPVKIAEATHFGAESEYPTHDWQADPSGKALLDQAGIAKRSDLQGRVRGWADSFRRYSADFLAEPERTLSKGVRESERVEERGRKAEQRERSGVTEQQIELFGVKVPLERAIGVGGPTISGATFADSQIAVTNNPQIPAEIGRKLRALPAAMQGRRHVYGMGESEQRIVAAAIHDLIEAGLPSSWFDGVQGFGAYDTTYLSYHAAWVPAHQAVLLKSLHLRAMDSTTSNKEDKQLLRGWIAHEVTHALDGTGIDSIAVRSPRLDIAVEGEEAGVYLVGKGDIMREVVKVYDDASHPLSNYFSYPLDNVLEGNLAEVEFAKYEVLAQLGRLYMTNPTLMKAELPLAYNALSEVFNAENSLEAGRAALQEALRAPDSTGADARDLRRAAVEGSSGRARRGSPGEGRAGQGVAGLPAGAGEPRGEPAVGVGDKLVARSTPSERIARAHGFRLEPIAAIPASRKPGHVNYATIDTTDEVKGALSKLSGLYKADIEKQRRGKVSWEQTYKEAEENYAKLLGIGRGKVPELLMRKPGTADAAYEILARRELAVGAAEELMDQAEKIAANPTAVSQDDMAAFLAQIERTGMITAQFLGARAEAGRTMNILRSTKRASARMEALQTIITQFKGPENIASLAALIKDYHDPSQMLRFAKEARKATTWDMLMEAWKAGLLSAIRTHAVNILSSLVTTGLRIPEHALAGGFGKLHGGDKVFFAETAAMGVGMVKGVIDGAQMFWEVMKSGEMQGDVSSHERYAPAITGENMGLTGPLAKVADLLGGIVRLPYRFLTSEDAFFRTMNDRMERYAQATRHALKTHGSGSFFERVAAHAESDIVAEKAEEAGRYFTFNRRLGNWGQAFQHLVGRIPPLQIVFPFVRTPANILKFGLERTPLAPMFPEVREALKKGGAERDIALARITMGSAMALTAMSLAGAGFISGGGVPDREQRRIKREAGRLPYAVRVGNKWYSYRRLEPLGMLLGMAADGYEFWDYMQQPEKDKWAAMLAGAFAQNVTSKTFLQGMTSLVNMATDPGRYGENYWQSLAGTIIPTGIAHIAQDMDPVIRETDTILDAILARIPEASKTLAARKDTWGKDLTREDRLGPDLISPIEVSEQTKDPVRREAARLKLDVQLPEKKIYDVKLTPHQRSMYGELAGVTAHEVLEAIVNEDGYNGLQDWAKRELFEEIIRQTRGAARELMIPEIGVDAIVDKKVKPIMEAQ